MKTMSAREAKNGSKLMIDTARAEPVMMEKARARRGGGRLSGSARYLAMRKCFVKITAL